MGAIDVIWWRRANHPQLTPPQITDPAYVDLINNDCSTALLGVLSNEFEGSWVSDPTNTRTSENKVIQLRAAQRAGFRVPRTLVSQDPIAVRQFYEALGKEVIVKPVKGTHKAGLLTQQLTEDHLAATDAIRLCPAIYQEYILGGRHIRAQCFGANVYAVMIESHDLDWRANLNVHLSVVDLAEDMKTKLRCVLGLLGLKMGIVDLKLTEEGEAVWLEVNPQGQFLFAEGLTGLDLKSAFADFLYQEAGQVSERT